MEVQDETLLKHSGIARYGLDGGVLQRILQNIVGMLPRYIGERNTEVFDLWERGMPIPEIAAQKGLTNHRVARIIEEVGELLLNRVTKERLGYCLE